MLEQLRVKDFALIEQAQIQLDEHFNVLTGETGAGKSIIIDAVSLLLGRRARTGDVRTGCEKARVEGVFRVEESSATEPLLAEYGIETEDGLLILQREISAEGKNSCRINDRTVTLATFRTIGQSLINIYGQNDFQAISNKEHHMDLLDSMGDAAFRQLKNQLADAYSDMLKIKREKAELEQFLKEQTEKQEFLLFKQKELEALKLQAGEEEELDRMLGRMDHAERILSATREAYLKLYGEKDSAYSQLMEVAEELTPLAEYDASLGDIGKQLQEISYLVEDFGRTLSSYQEKMDFDEESRNRMNERKYILDRAKRKYQCTLEELIIQRDQIAGELERLATGDTRMEELTDSFRAYKKVYLQVHEKVQQTRRVLAKELSEKLIAQLKELAMENTRFEVRFSESNPTARGMETAEFYMSANPGEPLRELREIASGGEMSRIMLAFKTVLAEKEKIGTLIFDEIDTGIGGNILGNVADKLESVSKHEQVICVTHAPIIAARATSHFKISKQMEANRTETTVTKLTADEEIQELARMLGGKEEIQLQHAKALKRK